MWHSYRSTVSFNRAWWHLRVFDDDPTIRQFWDRRITSNPIQHFSSLGSFTDYVLNLELESQPRLFLIDYEIDGHRKNGLDLIGSFGIAPYSILVTGRFDDVAVQARFEKMGVPILPKAITAWAKLK